MKTGRASRVPETVVRGFQYEPVAPAVRLATARKAQRKGAQTLLSQRAAIAKPFLIEAKHGA